MSVEVVESALDYMCAAFNCAATIKHGRKILSPLFALSPLKILAEEFYV
jgi:hypothetical protein